MKTAHARRWHLRASSPLRVFLETDAFLWDFVPSDFTFTGSYLPALQCFTVSWRGAGYPFNPVPRRSRYAVPLCSSQLVRSVVGGVISGLKMSQSHPQHRALGAAPGVLRSKGQVSF